MKIIKYKLKKISNKVVKYKLKRKTDNDYIY